MPTTYICLAYLLAFFWALPFLTLVYPAIHRSPYVCRVICAIAIMGMLSVLLAMTVVSVIEPMIPDAGAYLNQ